MEQYNPKNPDAFKQMELPEEEPPKSNIEAKIKGLSVLVEGDFISPNYRRGETGFRISSNGDVEFNDGVFRGQLQANSIDIPDDVTTNSFHTDEEGNSWWGATTLATAPAYITKDGKAKFTGVSTLEVQISTIFENSGRFDSVVYGGGGVAFGSSGGTITTGATASSSSDLLLNFYLGQFFNPTNSSFSAIVCVNNLSTVGEGSAYFGLGTRNVDGSGHGAAGAGAGFYIEKTGGIATLYAVTALATSAALTTLDSLDVLDLIFKINDDSTVDFYYRKNDGDLSSQTSLAIDLGSPLPASLQYSTSNNNSAFSNNYYLVSTTLRR